MTVLFDKDKQKRDFICGYEDTIAEKEKRKKVIQSLLSSVLIHDEIYLTLQNFKQVLDYIGPEDTFLLLSLKCLKIIADQNTQPVILLEKNKFSFFALSFVDDEIENFIKSLKDESFISKKQKNEFILCTEDSLIKCDHQKLQQLIRQENLSDLNNINICADLDIHSQNADDLNPFDIFKLLRMANISKGLIYQSDYDIGTTAVDGYALKYLQSKLGNVFKKVASQSDITFSNILKIKGIPDLSALYQKNIIKMHDIIELRENFNGRIFREWYSSIDYNQDKFLLHLTNIKKEDKIKKFLRWVIPNAIGLFSPATGIVTSALDSYIVEKIISGWQPNIFLDNHLKEQIDKKVEAHEMATRKKELLKKFGTIGRNERCPCQSGKKFKKCCGKS